jgi:hypothetical protein
MTWSPVKRLELEAMVSRDLVDCLDEQKQFFARVRLSPLKWKLSPWGDRGGGFWVVAVYRDRVLWFNDIEDGFNVSRYEVAGEIPADEYWCNHDPLRIALAHLLGDPSRSSTAPERAGSARRRSS